MRPQYWFGRPDNTKPAVGPGAFDMRAADRRSTRVDAGAGAAAALS